MDGNASTVVDRVEATAKWTAVQSARAAQGKQRKRKKKKRDRGKGCVKQTPRDGGHEIRRHCQSHWSAEEAVATGRRSDGAVLDELDGTNAAAAAVWTR
jgi:hypothetical protein